MFIHLKKSEDSLVGPGLMAINVGCEFRGRGSISSVCQITDAELSKLANLNHSLHGGLLLD